MLDHVLSSWRALDGKVAPRQRCVGWAPDRLTWQIGIRPGAEPLATYRSGDVELR